MEDQEKNIRNVGILIIVMVLVIWGSIEANGFYHEYQIEKLYSEGKYLEVFAYDRHTHWIIKRTSRFQTVWQKGYFEAIALNVLARDYREIVEDPEDLSKQTKVLDYLLERIAWSNQLAVSVNIPDNVIDEHHRQLHVLVSLFNHVYQVEYSKEDILLLDTFEHGNGLNEKVLMDLIEQTDFQVLERFSSSRNF